MLWIKKKNIFAVNMRWRSMLVKNGKRFRYYLSLENRQFSNEWRDNSNKTLHVHMAWGCCLSFIRAFGDASNEGELQFPRFFVSGSKRWEQEGKV